MAENGNKSGGRRTVSPLTGADATATQFKKNNPGGPGRPKVRPYREAMERVLEELGPKALDDVSKAMLKQAKKGNVQAAKEVRETLDGRGLDINANITSRLSDLDHVSVDDLISLSKEADES